MGYSHQKYTWSRPFGSVNHQWELVGPKGGIHFHVALIEKYPPSAGLEIHRFAPADYQKNDPPSQMPCWLLHAPCWHDGTSLYAGETLWPMIKPMLMSGDHETIFRILESEADERFGIRCEEVEEG